MSGIDLKASIVFDLVNLWVGCRVRGSEEVD